jgi:hypothetical protein
MTDKSAKIFGKWVVGLIVSAQHISSKEERSDILEQIENAAMDMGLAEWDDETKQILDKTIDKEEQITDNTHMEDYGFFGGGEEY